MTRVRDKAEGSSWVNLKQKSIHGPSARPILEQELRKLAGRPNPAHGHTCVGLALELRKFFALLKVVKKNKDNDMSETIRGPQDLKYIWLL